MKRWRGALLLTFLIISLIAVNYPFLDKKFEEFLTDYKYANVVRIIDGDTIEIENKESVRLLGINTPEKNELYYQEAKEFLEELIFNKTVKLEFGKDKRDKYNRTLAYVFINNKNINIELVKEGLANFYFPSGKDKYYSSFKKTWEECLVKGKNLCEKSKDECAGCTSLKELNAKNQQIIFYNNCSFDCNLQGWQIKHEGRKKFIFPRFILKGGKEVSIIVGEGKDNETDLFWSEEPVFAKTGDTLFLRDGDGKLVVWKSY